MKYIVILLLLPISIFAQRKILLGINTGFGQTLSNETSHFAYSQTCSFSTEGCIQIKSGLYWVIGSGYQSRIHAVKPAYDNEIIATRKVMNFMTWHAGLQWKSKWWYVGAGGFLVDMLGTNTEAYPAIYIDFPPIPTPRYFLSPVDYSTPGYYFQLGSTPPLTRNINAVVEWNWYGDFIKIYGNYPDRLHVFGAKVGLQYRFN